METKTPLIPAPLFIAALAVLGCLALVFVIWFVTSENTIYYWDSATYQGIYADLGHKLITQPLKAIDSINVSMRKADYNNVGVIPLMPFYLIFGDGRLAYISAVALMYAVPGILLLPYVVVRLASPSSDGSATQYKVRHLFVVTIIVFALLPQLWAPVLTGYIDVAGVLVSFAILILHFRSELADKGWRDLTLLGGLICLLVLLRRWYAYWVIGYFVAAAADVLYMWRRRPGRSLVAPLKRLGIIAITAATGYFVLATQMFIKILWTDYRDIYSAYRTTDSLAEHIRWAASYFGPFTVALIILGIIVSLADREIRRTSLFLLVLFVTAFITFTNTQDLGEQHYYWVIATLIIFTGFLIMRLTQLERPWVRYSSYGLIALLSAVNFSAAFIPAAAPFTAFAAPVFGDLRMYPATRGDLPELTRMVNDLHTLTTGRDSRIYVVSSSPEFNAGVLVGACDKLLTGSEAEAVKRLILATSEVDKRDGFPFQFYTADIVLVSDPVGYHLAPKDQRVVGELSDRLLNAKGIGRSFQRLDLDYVLDSGYHVHAFKKVDSLRRDALVAMSDLFVELYPDKRSIFEISPEQIKRFSEQ